MMKNKILVVIIVAGVLIIFGFYFFRLQKAEITPTEEFAKYFPPILAKDFYPNNMTREKVLARLPKATQKTGAINQNETWAGVIKITGDLTIQQGITVTIKPGTIVFVSARSDDQRSGVSAPRDAFNPKDPVRDKNYVKNRVEIFNHGNLIAKGTKEQPVIITSDSLDPQSDDWIGISTNEGTQLEFQRVLIEYFRVFGISSSQATISQSIIRNILETVVIIGERENLLTVSPILTQNYIYNCGHHCVTVRSGSPIVTHNIIRARPDMRLPGFEKGAFTSDFPVGNPVIEHNLFEGGLPEPFEAETSIGYRKETVANGLGLRGQIHYKVINNTICNSGVGINTYPGPWILENNNIFNNTQNLQLVVEKYEPSDIWQIELFKKGVIKQPEKQTFSAPNNFWGKEGCPAPLPLSAINCKPAKTEFIKEALPDWQEFKWE